VLNQRLEKLWPSSAELMFRKPWLSTAKPMSCKNHGL
jgi:hypothetical protein